MKKVGAVQSCYIPWKGYFDIIHSADVFVFYDCAQYTKRDWRNRNQIFVDGKKIWRTIPIKKHPVETRINEVRMNNRQVWFRRHWKSLVEGYRRAPYFDEVMDLINPFLCESGLASSTEFLSTLNQAFTKSIASYLGIGTELVDSAGLKLTGSGTDRILDLLQKLEGDSFLTGPKAKEYIQPEKFKKHGIHLEYKDYSGYPEYPQFSNRFDHHVSILDLLFQVGPKAPDYIWGWRR